jgi:hypothetical protein
VALLICGRVPTQQSQSREYLSRGDMIPLDSARMSRDDRLTEKGRAIVKASERGAQQKGFIQIVEQEGQSVRRGRYICCSR